MLSKESQQRINLPHWLCEQHRLLWENGDHLVALGGNHPFPRVLLAVDLVFHKEVSLLLEIGATVAAHVALRVTLLVPDLHKHPSGEEPAPLSAQHCLPPPQPPPTQSRPKPFPKVNSFLLFLTSQSRGPTSGQADINSTFRSPACAGMAILL